MIVVGLETDNELVKLPVVADEGAIGRRLAGVGAEIDPIRHRAKWRRERGIRIERIDRAPCLGKIHGGDAVAYLPATVEAAPVHVARGSRNIRRGATQGR